MEIMWDQKNSDGNVIGTMQESRGVRVWRLFFRGRASFTASFPDSFDAKDVLDRAKREHGAFAVEPV